MGEGEQWLKTTFSTDITPKHIAHTHKHEDENEQPEVGEMSLFLTLLFQLGDLRDAVDKGPPEGGRRLREAHSKEAVNRSTSATE